MIYFAIRSKFGYFLSTYCTKHTMTKLRHVSIKGSKDTIPDFSDAISQQKNETVINETVAVNGYYNDLNTVLEEAWSCLMKNNIIAVPTDTIYGIAGLAQSSEAVSKIYKMKGRDGGKPISICVNNVEQVHRWGKVTVPNAVLEDLLPGPVTVVLERTEKLNPDLNPGTSLVGIRVPDHDFICDLCKKCDGPLALTSANISKQQSTLTTQEFSHLWPQLDLVVDGGVLGNTEESRLGSTVVDLSQDGKFTIIRPGSALVNTKKILTKHGLSEYQEANNT